MIQATWNGTVLAESDQTVVVEGNHYFPPDSVRWEYLQKSPTHTRCVWKGVASYYTVVVDGQENQDAAWYYPDPSRAAVRITGRVAFWHGVRVRHVDKDGTPIKRSPLSRLLHR
jgi:uncharacterized protein (DUF427 family)